MDPQYFFYQMQWWEVQRYINGLRRRLRPQWESARFVAWVQAHSMGAKTPTSQQDFYPFPWEKEQILSDEERQAKEAAELLLAEQCRQANQQQDKQQS